MTINIEEVNEEWALSIVYVPNEDDIEENKTQFYKCLQRTFETTDRKVFLLGDINARVGNNSEMEWSDRRTRRRNLEQ
jgi:HKD family nuclease